MSPTWIRARVVLTALVCVFLLSGCLLTRLYAFKQQFCDYRRHFSFDTQNTFRVDLSVPLLRDSDVIWLAGAPPTGTTDDTDGRQLQWLVHKVLPAETEPDPAFDQLMVDMAFEPDGDNYLLKKVVMDQRFAYVVSPDLMDRHAENVCRSSWLVLGRSGEIDLADADLSGQPDRQEIIQYLGTPSAWTDDGGIVFEYRLEGSTASGRQYSFEFWHDEDSGELLRSTTSSIRFTSTTDFVAKKMWVQVK